LSANYNKKTKGLRGKKRIAAILSASAVASIIILSGVYYLRKKKSKGSSSQTAAVNSTPLLLFNTTNFPFYNLSNDIPCYLRFIIIFCQSQWGLYVIEDKSGKLAQVSISFQDHNHRINLIFI